MKKLIIALILAIATVVKAEDVSFQGVFNDIATAIRSSDGGGGMTPSQMAPRIAALPNENRVYGQIAGVSNQVMTVDAKVSALTPSASYPQTCHVTFTLGGYTPSASVASKMLAGGCFVRLKIGNEVHKYPLSSLSSGTSISTIVSVSRPTLAYVSFIAPTISDEQVLFTEMCMTFADGGNYSIPITLRKASESLFAIGRLQKIDDNTSASFLITRDCASTNNYSPVTLFGYYLNDGTTTTWVNETGVVDGHPIITGSTITGSQGDFETRIFPWAQAEKRTVTLNYTPSQGNNNFYFTWIPSYYWRLEDVTLPFRTYNSSTGVWTTNDVPCRVHWISKSQLPGFTLPPWAYIHAYDSGSGAWSTVGVKDGYYYARYDSVMKDGKMQSAPFATMNTGYTRHDSTVMCHALNQYTSTITDANGGVSVISPDASNRLWAAPMYENYAPFRELAYIQFGASMKSVFYGGSRSNLNSLETEFETAGASIKSFATGSGTSANFAWLYIWNPFYGSEGSVMSDASYVANNLDGTNKEGQWWVCPDRAADIGGATTVSALESSGAFKLAYTYNTTGKTNMESKRCIDSTTIQSSIYWFPGSTSNSDICSVRVTDESGWYGGFPSSTGASVYGNCLSNLRGYAAQLGLWCVYAANAPSNAAADRWGSRPSFAPYRATGEAQSE